MDKLQQIKNFWDNRPCNIKHSPKPVGTKEYFNEVEKRRYFVEPHIPFFAQFEKWKGKKVLELGCGIGTESVNFARAGADITLVELSGKSLDLCKKRFEVYNLKGSFYCGNIEELSSFVPVEKYDLIYSFGTIHHACFPEKVFAEIKKYCSPHTEVRVMLYSKWCWKVFWIIIKYGKGAFWKANELVAKYSEAQFNCPVTHYYSFREIRNMMKDFEIISIKKDFIFTYKIEKYIKYEYAKIWYFSWMPRFLFNWIKKYFGWHTLIIAKLK